MSEELSKNQIDDPGPGIKIHFDEFKMVFDSAEKITDRRLELHRSNTSLCLLIIAGIGAVIGWSYEKPTAFPFALIAVSTISSLASFFCIWWYQQMISYKQLNKAKFDVLNEMAPHLVFKDNFEGYVKSFAPFKREWAILEEQKALQSFEGGLALGASGSEKRVPIAFLLLYMMLVAMSFIMFFARGYHTMILSFIVRAT